MGQLEDIQVFIRVVESGGIGRAAEQLNIAKSAVSRRLSELEARLGCKLINRTTRSFSLTGVGKTYYERALKVADSVTEMNTEVANVGAALSGVLRIAVPQSFGLMHLTPAIDLFVKQHPEITIQIDFSDRHVDIVEEGFDVALRISGMKDSNFQARRLCPVHHVLAASPEYLQRKGSVTTISDLKHHQMLKYTGSSIALWSIIDANGKEHQLSLTKAMSANSGDFLKDMAIAGHGIVNLPTFLIWKALASGDLVRLLPDCSMTTIDAYAIYPMNRFLPKRARLFIDFLVERFGDNPYWDQHL